MSGSGPKQVGTANLLSPEQRDALSAILGSDIGRLIDPDVQANLFQRQVADPAMEQFRRQIIPALQEQFIGAGAANSSGLNRALADRAGQFQVDLAGEAAKFQQQGLQNQLALLAQALGRQTNQPIISQGSPSPLAGLLGGIGMGLGGPLGETLGGKLFGSNN